MAAGLLKKKKNLYLAELEEAFDLPATQAKEILRNFQEAMEAGLTGKPGSLKMLPAFVARPRGTERGRFWALDLGGTYCRVLEVALEGNRKARITAAIQWPVPKTIRQGVARDLFDFLAQCLRDFRDRQGKGNRDWPLLSFTFSFPLRQQSVTTGTLISWTKGYSVQGVEGREISRLFQAALKRKGLDIRLAALTNDTVGTLMAGAYAEANCDVGLILGTGTNACYPEAVPRVKGLKNPPGLEEIIINTEWGGFDRVPSNRFDALIDQRSLHPGRQRLEKIVSGMYLGEIARLVLHDMRHQGLLRLPESGGLWDVPYGLKAQQLSDLIDGKSAVDVFGSKGWRAEEEETIRRVGEVVVRRSARLAASALAAVLTWRDASLQYPHTVAVDGALFERFPGYRCWMEEMLRELFGRRSKNIRLRLTPDGSGLGAAIVGAVAAAQKKGDSKGI